jgi:hypothetical protein
MILTSEPATEVAVNAFSNTIATAQANNKRRKRRQTATIEHPERVLFFLNLNNPVRKLCIKFVEWK